MSETDPYPHCNATIDLGTRGIHLCYLRAGHSGSHQHNELMVAMVERGALVPNKWDGNLGGGRWVPLKIHQDKLKEQMSNTIAWQMQAEKAADACTLALAERDALREQLAGARARALLVFVALGGDQGESESLDAAVSRIVAERDALRADLNAALADYTEARAQLAARDRELELLREVERVARDTRDAMDITLSSDDLDGEWEFENTVPIWHDRLAARLSALDAYRAAQADEGKA